MSAPASGNDINLQGTTVQADGSIALAAGRDVNLFATQDSYSEDHESRVKKSGFVLNHGLAPMQQGKATDRDSSTTQTIAHGATLSGDSVTVAAGRNIYGEGAQIAATKDILLAAGNDLTLTTAENTYGTGQNKSVTYTGFSRQGLNDHYGKVKDTQGQSETQVTHTGSMVGSTNGQVTLTSGNDLHLTGTDVISNTATTIVGKNVTIDAAVDTVDTTQYQRHNEGGVTVGLGGSLMDLAMDVRQSVRRGNEVEDSRLKTLYAAKAAYDVKDVYDSIAENGIDVKKGGGAGQEGLNVQVGIGGKSASSKTSSHDETSFGSHIRSNGDVTIAATGGDLTIVGSEISGNNVALAATHDINLLSQAENHSLKNDSKNSSGGVGVSFGTDGFGIYAEASVGNGKARGNGITHAETTINADNVLTMISGNDTTIQGAQLKGSQVIADIGNNLTIRSEQDTDDFSSKTMQAGAKVMFGLTQSGFVSASGYYSQGKVDSHYQGVNEVSGIKAGDGGFQMVVGGTTHLIGGQIASTADASKNLLSTGDLVYEDLHNESKYKASQVSVSGGSTMSSNIAGAIGAGIGLATPQHENESSDTKSGIAAGTIVVRNKPAADLSGLDRNPTLENEALKNVFDAEKVADRQEMGQVAGYIGFRGAGTLADKEGWPEGSPERAVLHGAVGAAVAALGGGNALNGAVGSAASQLATNAIQGYLWDHNIDPNSPEGKTYMQLASIAIGGIGGGSGSASALNGEKFNRELHETEKARIKSLAGGDARKEADLSAAACALVHCSAQYAIDTDAYILYSDLERRGSQPEYAEDRALLASQTFTYIGTNIDGKATPITEGLFSYDFGDRVSDGLSLFNDSHGHPFTRAGGGVQAIGGGVSAVTGGILVGTGAVACPESLGAGCAVAGGGIVLAGWGADQFQAGVRTAWNGSGTQTLGGYAIANTFGVSPAAAELIYGVVGIPGTTSAANALSNARELNAAFATSRLAGASDSTDAVASVWHATSSEGVAQSILNGVDPKYFNANSRFGGAFYVAEDAATTVSELAEHGTTPVNGIRFELNKGAMKVLDLTDPSVAAKWATSEGSLTPQAGPWVREP